MTKRDPEKKGFSRAMSNINFTLLKNRSPDRLLPHLHPHPKDTDTDTHQHIKGMQLEAYLEQLLKFYDVKIQENKDQKDKEAQRQSQKRRAILRRNSVSLLPSLQAPLLEFNQDNDQRFPEEMVKIIDQRMDSYRPKCCSMSKVAEFYSAKEPDDPRVMRSARREFEREMKKHGINLLSSRHLASIRYK